MEATIAPRRVDIWRFLETFGRLGRKKLAKRNDGGGEEGNTSERKGNGGKGCPWDSPPAAAGGGSGGWGKLTRPEGRTLPGNPPINLNLLVPPQDKFVSMLNSHIDLLCGDPLTPPN